MIALVGEQGLILIGLVLAMGVARLLARGLARRIIRARTRRTGQTPPPTLERPLVRASGLLAMAATGAAFLPSLDLAGRVALFAERGIEALAIVSALLFALALLDVAAQAVEAKAGGRNERVDRLLLPMTRKFARAAIFTVAVLVGLGVFGVNVAGLIAGLGITGLVLALAAKDSVENVFGSITILFDVPFAIGDHVRIDKYEGAVEEINLRSTRIRTLEDSVVTLPNSNLIRSSVENFGPRRFRRQRLTVLAGHITPPARVEAFCADLRAWLGSRPDADDARTQVEPHDLTEPALAILVQAFFEVPDTNAEMAARGDLVLEIERLRTLHRLARPGQTEE